MLFTPSDSARPALTMALIRSVLSRTLNDDQQKAPKRGFLYLGEHHRLLSIDALILHTFGRIVTHPFFVIFFVVGVIAVKEDYF